MTDDPIDRRIGRCEHCGGGVWEDDDHVKVRSRVFHRSCAERLASELQDAL